MDETLAGFLAAQHAQGLELARSSPLLDLEPCGGVPSDRWIARLACRGLVQGPAGDVAEAEGFAVGIWLPEEYLRAVNPFECVTLLTPPGAPRVFHPNCGPGPGGRDYVCIGHLVPGTPLVDIVLQCWEIFTWQNATFVERNALNGAACAWARANLGRLPIDRRTILGRELPPRALAALAAQRGLDAAGLDPVHAARLDAAGVRS